MKDNLYHRLLKRQIKKFISQGFDKAAIEPFLDAVNQAYRDFDKDINHAENILEQSSKELFASNKALKESYESKKREAQALSQRIRSVANNINEIIFQTDTEGHWTFLNPAWEKISGYSINESLGKKFYDFIYPEDKEISIKNLEKLITSSKNTIKYTIRYIAKSNEVRWAQANVSLDFDERGNLIGSSGVLNDITEAKKAEEKIKQINKNLAEAQKIAKLGSWEYSADNLKNGYWTEQLFQIMGMQYDANVEVPLEYLYRLAAPQDKLHVENVINRALKYGEPEETTYSIKVGNKTKWISLSANPIVTTGGKTIKLVGTVLDITKQKETEQKLKEAREIAENALAAKSDFLSNMSHEIRTPMNAIMGLTELLIKDKSNNQDQLDNLKLINYSAENLLVIINDVLDYSKIEADKIQFESINFKVGDVVDKLIKTFKIKAEEKNLHLSSDLDPEVPDIVVGDPYRLNQILINLLSNALKFTHEGRVRLSVKLLEESYNRVRLYFSVSDTGIGIPQEKQKAIFESFTQANNKITRNFGGTGLGLAIAKRLVENQGGEIGLESQESVGTNFFFELVFKTSDLTVVEAGSLNEEEKLDLNNVKLLVAEDNQVNQLLIKQIGKGWGIYVDIASNGLEALEKSRQTAFDIILMDLQMPEMDGYEAAYKIKNDEDGKNKETPIIALSADVSVETKKRIRELGFDNYLSKPFKSKELKKLIRTHIT